MNEFNILSIDAWRNREGGWCWNDCFKAGKIPRALVENYTVRKLLKYLREENFLSDASKGCVTIDDDSNYITIIRRGDSMPLIAIECHW